MKYLASFTAAGLGACILALSTPAFAQVDINIAVSAPPPAVIVEPPPPPRVGYLWVSGFWGWNGDRHVWQAGHWEAERDGEFYTQSRWVESSDGWRFVPGHWERRDRDEGKHGGNFCPPGQAKKGNC